MNLKQNVVFLATIMLVVVMGSDIPENPQPSEQESTIDIEKFLQTEGEERVMVVSFSISPNSLEPCKVDFYSNTTHEGTYFDRYYLTGDRNRNSRLRGRPPARAAVGRKGRESLMGVFTNLGKAQEPKQDTMKVYKYSAKPETGETSSRDNAKPKKQETSKGGKTLVNEPSPTDVETIEYQSRDDLCAVFSTSRRQTNNPQTLLELRVRASAIPTDNELPCLTGVQGYLQRTTSKFPQLPVLTTSGIRGCQQRCLSDHSCNPNAALVA
uniref:Putative lipocalin-3 1 n=1 Tax=Amblyomma triste TaxID=251400 RepID=A0A023GAB5_AMBTT